MKDSMVIITSTWGKSKTFKLIPTEINCPYNECIFDPEAKVLALIGKEKKQSMHMLPKLNEFGDLQTLKIGKRPNGKDYAEERKTIDTFYEYYIEDINEVEDFIRAFCINADSFDYKKYLESVSTKTDGPTILTSI
jgi:hypothetical protein